MRVLVCGGRDFGCVSPNTPYEAMANDKERAWNEARLINDTLTTMYVDGIVSEIIHGNAPGADSVAAYWAKRNVVKCTAFKADWKTHGKAAGPIRNQQMIDEGKPDLVVAFPVGKGTADMVKRAKESGIEVIEI